MAFIPTHEDVRGVLMTAYYGGRAECHIRHVLTRVAYADVRSMYPTVSVLMNLWRWWVADRIEVYDATEEVRNFLTSVTLRDLLLPKAWTRLPFLALLDPEADRLPVRAQYIDGGDYQVGLNFLTSPLNKVSFRNEFRRVADRTFPDAYGLSREDGLMRTSVWY